MIDPDRRKCTYYDRSNIIYDFQKANHHILDSFKQNARIMCQEGIRFIQIMAEQYIKSKKSQDQSQLSLDTANFNDNLPEIQQSQFSFRLPIGKKQLIQQDQSTQNDTKRILKYSQKKVRILQENSIQSQDSDSESKKQELKKSLKKLGISQEDIQQKDDIDFQKEKENWETMNGIINKPLEQIIKESNKKLMEALSRKKQQQQLQEQEYQSQDYQMSDYSSNQSSNHNDYGQNLRDTIGNLTQSQQYSSQQSIQYFTSWKQTQSNFSTLPYATCNIAMSPKKSKSKRVFQGQKKIPKWAEDLNEINKLIEKQNNDPNIKPQQEIYGICVIENLNAKELFGRFKPQMKSALRGSSARWKDDQQEVYFTY